MDTKKNSVPIFFECRLPNDQKEYVQCSQCCTWYHPNCAMVPEWAIKRKWQRQKHAKHHSTRTAQLFCAENGSKKHQISEKWDNFENRPSCEDYSPCKGYSLCKMVTLGPKLKFPKTREERLYNHTRVDLYRKRLQKIAHIFEKWQLFENGQSWPLCKGYSVCKIGSLVLKLKFPEACRLFNYTRVFLCKKHLQKLTNSPIMTAFRKSSKWATRQRL